MSALASNYCTVSITLPINQLAQLADYLLASQQRAEATFVADVPAQSSKASPEESADLSAQIEFIYKALTDRPLNNRQLRILRYWADNYPNTANIRDLNSLFVQEHLAATESKADEYVRGSLRSFGRRLKIDGYEAEIDPPPIRHLVEVHESDGQRHHRLTAAGLAAVKRLPVNTI